MTAPVQSITVVLADQRMEPLRPDVTIEWDAERRMVVIDDADITGTWSPTMQDFYAVIGSYFLDGWRKLVSLSTNVAGSDYETPLEKDSAMSAKRRKGASDG